MSKAWTHPASTKDYVVKHLKVDLIDISLIKKKVEHLNAGLEEAQAGIKIARITSFSFTYVLNFPNYENL